MKLWMKVDGFQLPEDSPRVIVGEEKRHEGIPMWREQDSCKDNGGERRRGKLATGIPPPLTQEKRDAAIQNWSNFKALFNGLLAKSDHGLIDNWMYRTKSRAKKTGHIDKYASLNSRPGTNGRFKATDN
ncbi:hypothetical protein LAZ67_7001052 [Cordylochernes scorpioides]|uniref:Uncharacterized protein n=1 Tax=Cordylochernes scorpioides TaxID=51811 RepID=A0ABY6KQJ4_9ARAC|nr:hypothetical protein LAZ67_7001052 [Cordylochernes scorpioides]